MTNWIKLSEKLPEGHGTVLLFPVKIDVGHLYVLSNSDYARVNALKDGFTHWLPFEPHPNELEQHELNQIFYGDD